MKEIKLNLADLGITNKTTRELVDEIDATVRITYLWNNHGDLIDMTYDLKDELFWSPNANIKIYKEQSVYNFASRNNDVDYESYVLVVNGQEINGDLIDCSIVEGKNGKCTALCKVIYGWG